MQIASLVARKLPFLTLFARVIKHRGQAMVVSNKVRTAPGTGIPGLY